MEIFLTGDQHYGHLVGASQGLRNFDNVEEMNEQLIENHNSVVRGKKTRVIHLGDFALRMNAEKIEQIFKRLKGDQHDLIFGNHDYKKLGRILPVHDQLPWNTKNERLEIKHDGKTIVLSHYAQMVWNKGHYGSLHAFGHSHGNLTGMPGSIDVGVDAQNLAPIHIDDFILQAERSLDDCESVINKIKQQLDQRSKSIKESRLEEIKQI